MEAVRFYGLIEASEKEKRISEGREQVGDVTPEMEERILLNSVIKRKVVNRKVIER